MNKLWEMNQMEAKLTNLKRSLKNAEIEKNKMTYLMHQLKSMGISVDQVYEQFVAKEPIEKFTHPAPHSTP